MTTIDLRTELQTARREVRVANVAVDQLPADLADAYRFAFTLMAADDVAAWKIGGANPWSQAAFGNSDPFFGALSRNELLINTPSVDISTLYQPLAEPEIMLEIGSLPDDEGRATFSRIGLGVEIPASVLPDDAKQQLSGQIVDRAGAGLIWVGNIQPFNEKMLGGLTVRFGKISEDLTEGGSHNVVNGAAGAVQAFLRIAKALGAPLAQGQWIATAGLVKAISVSPGDTVVVETPDGHLEIPFI